MHTISNEELLQVLKNRVSDAKCSRDSGSTHVLYTKTGVDYYIFDFYTFRSYQDAVDFNDARTGYKFIHNINNYITFIEQEIGILETLIAKDYLKDKTMPTKSYMSSLIAQVKKHIEEDPDVKYIVYDTKTLEPHIYLIALHQVNTLGETLHIGSEFYMDTIEDYLETLRLIGFQDYEVPVTFIVSAPTKEIATMITEKFIDQGVIDGNRIDIRQKKGN